MKKIIKIFVLVTGTLSLFLPSAFAATAPGGVNEIIEVMEQFEENFESDKWQEALEAIDKISKELNEIFAEAQLDDFILEKTTTDLRNSVVKKNEKETEVNFVRFQNRFFIFISHFDYDVHPILKMIEEYIFEETAEAAEKKEFDEVASEMVEVGNLIKAASPLLLEKGVSDEEISGFKSEVFNLIKAARKEDINQVNSSLKKVMEMYKSFMDRYKQA